MKILLLAILLIECSFSRADNSYIDAVKNEVLEASTTNQKIAAYEKWLPLGILVHHPDIKKDLDSFKVMADGQSSQLASGIYQLNTAYYLVEYFGDYLKGLELCISAKGIFESINAKPQLVVAYNRLAFLVLWNEIGKKKTILNENLNEKYLSKALAIAKEIKNTDLQVLTLAFIGSYYNVTEQDNKKAIDYFFEAEKLLTNNSPPDLRVAVLESIAIVYADEPNKEKMLYYANKCEALPFFQTFGYGRSNMYRAMAGMYMKNGINKDLERALEYAIKSYNISIQMNAPEYISQGEQRLYEIYKAAGNEIKALFFLEKNRQHEDSLSRERFQRTYAEYDLQKKENLIAQQKLDLIRRNLLLYGAGIAALLLTVFFIYRFKKYQRRQKIVSEERRIQNELAIKDAEEKERKRIAAELHDNLGVQANAILHNSTLLNETNEDNKALVADLQETAREMLLNLRETLWAMKTTDVTTVELWLRIINFMNQMGRHYTNINFKVEGITPANLIISSSQALQIVLVLQESVNNSVKHAEAKTIIATSTAIPAGWKITLADDGRGFESDGAKLKNDSYGLSNMQQRAVDGNFKYIIETVINKGTITTLAISA